MTQPSTAAVPAAPPPAAEPPQPVWMKRVPVITGGLAALAGFLAVRGTNLANMAVYQSTQGVLQQTKASDAWAEYEAESLKATTYQATLDAGTADAGHVGHLTSKVAEYAARKDALRDAAKKAEAVRDDQVKLSTANLDEKDYCDYAGVAAQLGIALASVAALTRRQSAFNTAVLVGLAAVALAAYGLSLHYHVWGWMRHKL